MTVYLGTHGKVELKREFDGTLTGTIKPDDVNTTAKRFSFDFEHGQLLTGDQIEITSTDDSACLLYTSPSPRDVEESRMPSSA